MVRTASRPNGWRVGIASAALMLLLLSGPALAFTPTRVLPTSWDKVMVFTDQLPSLSAAQAQFAASHYVGTQKQTSGLIDAIRAYNPNFLMIQYRLGMRDSGDSVVFIHNNTWTSDWSLINPHEDWFLHDSTGRRVYMSYGSIKEWMLDPAGLVNGNTTNGWKQFWVSETKADIFSSHGDGVFADSSHLPYAIPSTFYTGGVTWHGGAPPHTPLMNDVTAWYQYVYAQYDAANLYFIPNIGSLCTTVDTNTCYYNYVHGAMVEGFAVKDADWQMQQDRTLQLLRNGKIYIAQNGPSSYSDIPGRVWYLSNFLLLRTDKSYLNLLGTSSQMHWAPEYDLNIGQPASLTVPGGVSELLVKSNGAGSGIYGRRFQFGLVLVNATGSNMSYTLGAADPHFLLTPWGGGNVPTSGVAPDGGWTYAAQAASVSVPLWGGAILTFAPGDINCDNRVQFYDYQILESNFGKTSGATRANGDFNFDGKVDFADYQLLEANFGYHVPEPATLTLLVCGWLGSRRRR